MTDTEIYGYEREPWEIEQDAESALNDLTEHGSGIDVHADGYTPDTETIRATYATEYYMTNVAAKGQRALVRAAAFDRWLEQHDREVLERGTP